MKKYITILLILLSFTAFSQKDKKIAEMTFKETFHNFKTVWYKTDASFDFVFKNTGKIPLVITKVESSCGCTVPTWEKEPLNRNKSGIIKVKYDSSRIGQFTKTIKVYSNAINSPVTITIQGEVKVTD